MRQMQTDDNKRDDSISSVLLLVAGAASILAKWIQTAEMGSAHASAIKTTRHTATRHLVDGTPFPKS
ncbi:hypothetical protein ANN_02066 [Periplaneta americana]|uniref:Uncharacterized protein n=1 Tax=Periplaneta americana TaxID=6978 RepID=A0ABQ8TX06_PERAM|nr:hypothetical protein ANN_02066 [Periplaneta americana]